MSSSSHWLEMIVSRQRIDSHVENVKAPRGYFLFPTWTRNISSEVSFHSSEVSFLAYVENVFSPRENSQFPTWGAVFPFRSSDICRVGVDTKEEVLARAVNSYQDFCVDYDENVARSVACSAHRAGATRHLRSRGGRAGSLPRRPP